MEQIFVLWLVLSFVIGLFLGALITALFLSKISFEDLERRVEQTNRHVLCLISSVGKQERCLEAQLSHIQTRLSDADSIVLIQEPVPVLDGQHQS